MIYEKLLSFGDIIPLDIHINPYKLLKQTSIFEYRKYNPRKDIKRFGLSLTSLDGTLYGFDLDSLYEYNRENNTQYDDSSFQCFTPVYNQSEEVRKVLDPWKKNIGRSHILYLPPGGHFPQHRDCSHYEDEQFVFRVIVPLQNCNPMESYFMYEDKPVIFNHGQSYFMNTNKRHAVFSMDECYMIVLNIVCNENSIKTLINNFSQK